MFWMEYLGQGMDQLLPALTLVSWASQRYVLYLGYSLMYFYLLWWVARAIFIFHSMILFRETILFRAWFRQTLHSVLSLPEHGKLYRNCYSLGCLDSESITGVRTGVNVSLEHLRSLVLTGTC